MFTKTTNGALTHATLGDVPLVKNLEYFAHLGTYRGRGQDTVAATLAPMFREQPRVATRLVFASRLITRKPKGEEEFATGFGSRDEFYESLVWLNDNHPEILKANLHLIPTFGSWKDFFQPTILKALSFEDTYPVIKAGFDARNDLLLKFLPQIRSKSQLRSKRDTLRSAWAKKFCKTAEISEKEYRKIKAAGNAHIFQKQMQANDWEKINFNGIPGKAMYNLSNSNVTPGVFDRHNQGDRFFEWAVNQCNIKFTGYVHDLVKVARTADTKVKKEIINKQFKTAIEPMKGHKLGNVLAVLDTSGSMGWATCSAGTPLDICLGLGLAFSSMNVGHFKDTVCMFDDHSILLKLKKDNFCDKLQELPHNAMGSTNFQSVIDEMVRYRKANPDVPVSEYPETMLVVSDMQFNPSSNYREKGNAETNYQTAMKKLSNVGLGAMRIIWWNVSSYTKDFPVLGDQPGCYLISGYDPNVLKGLMGLSVEAEVEQVAGEAPVKTVKAEQTPLDGMINLINQPIFDKVVV